MSYERAAKLLGDVLPLGAVPGSSSIKAHVRSAGQALATGAEEYGEHFFAEQLLKFPDPPTEPPAHVLELDAGHVRAIPESCVGGNCFGIMTGRLIKPEGPRGWHACVIDETSDPLTQLHGFLDRQGVAIDTPMAIIRDGGANVGTPTILFHISMRFEHILQRLRALCKTAPEKNSLLLRYAESAKWRMWHGCAAGCLERMRAIQASSDGSMPSRPTPGITPVLVLVPAECRHKIGLRQTCPDEVVGHAICLQDV